MILAPIIFADMRIPSVLCPVIETAAYTLYGEKYSTAAGGSQLKEFTISSSIHLQM